MSKWIAGLAVLLALALAAGAVVFEPWTKFTSSTVDEALPTVGSTDSTEVSERVVVGRSGGARCSGDGEEVQEVDDAEA